MVPKYAAFDLEIAKVVEGEDWKSQRPLGISCAAVLADDWEMQWSGEPQLSPEACADIVEKLIWLTNQGYTLVTWNGASFDFDILAEESGLLNECRGLTASHVDMMFEVVSRKGHYLGLDTAAKGMSIPGKKKSVTLKDGTVLEDMDGSKAPELWANGELDAVRSYLKEDVRVTLQLAQKLFANQLLRWTSQSGRPNVTPFLCLTVKQCLNLTPPDTGWMSSPPSRSAMLAWVSK